MTDLLKEKDIQRDVVALYHAVGAHAYSTSVYRPGGARIDAGIPDLIVLHPKLGVWFHETKRPKSKQSDEQILFQTRCAQANVVYVLGGVEEARAALELAGLVVG